MAKKDDKPSTDKAIQSAPQRAVSPADEWDAWFDDFVPRNWLAPFFRRGWPDLESAPFGGRMPKVDVIDRPQEIVVRAELPGVDKDHLDVSLSDRALTIRASTRHETKKEEEGHYHRRELSRGEFVRSITLPCEVDGDKAKAGFKDGVLELTIPKVESAKRKTIPVD